MKASIVFLFCLFAGATATLTKASPQNVKVSFYSEQLNFSYDDDMTMRNYIRFEDSYFKKFYFQMKRTPYRSLLQQFQQKKQQLGLNGWLYFKMINKTISTIFHTKSYNHQTLATWFFLAESGYDVRLTHKRKRIFLQAFTQDEIYEIPFYKMNRKTFVNLTAIMQPERSFTMEFYLVEFIPQRDGKAISFALDIFPRLSSNIITRTVNFYSKRQQYSLEVELDKTVIDLMRSYPMFDERYYLETPLSHTLYNSLIPQLRKLIKDKPQRDAVQLLLAFTRSAFDYKEDNDYFGKNKPMISDEVLYYAYSDCEDRSALFYNLVKDLLQLPMIIVAYKDHLTIGVQLYENIGHPLRHRGRKYTICDPTGPINSDKVGLYPKGYQRKQYQVIGAYR